MGSLLKERLQATKSREHEQEEVEAAAKLVAANDLSEDDEEVDEVKLRAAEESIVVDMDFAENYEIVHKVAIQSDHWSHQQVTLYIVIAHFKSGGKWTSEAHVFVSGDPYHDTHFVQHAVDGTPLPLSKPSFLCDIVYKA